VDVVYLHFGKTFDTIAHNILTDRLMKYRLHIEQWGGSKNS